MRRKKNAGIRFEPKRRHESFIGAGPNGNNRLVCLPARGRSIEKRNEIVIIIQRVLRILQ